MPEKVLKTGPDLVGEHHQKVWLGVQRKHAKQHGAGCQPGADPGQALALHLKHPAAVARRSGDELVLHAPAG